MQAPQFLWTLSGYRRERMARDHHTWGCGNSIIGKLYVRHVSCSSQGMKRRRGMAPGRNSSNRVLGVLCSLGAYRNCLRRSRAKARSASRSKTRAASPRRARDVWVSAPGTRRRRRISASIIYPFSFFLGVESGRIMVVCSTKQLKVGANGWRLKERKICITCRPLRSLNSRGEAARDTLSFFFFSCHHPLRSLLFVKNPQVFTLYARDDELDCHLR